MYLDGRIPEYLDINESTISEIGERNTFAIANSALQIANQPETMEVVGAATFAIRDPTQFLSRPHIDDRVQHPESIFLF